MDYQIADGVGGVEVTLTGRLTFDDNGTFRQMLEAVRRRGAGTVLVDVGGLEFIDSSGLGMLMLLREAVEGVGARITLSNPQGQVRRLMMASRFHSLVLIQGWSEENQ